VDNVESDRLVARSAAETQDRGWLGRMDREVIPTYFCFMEIRESHLSEVVLDKLLSGCVSGFI